MRKLFVLCIMCLFCCAFIACNSKSEPEKITENLIKSMQNKEYMKTTEILFGEADATMASKMEEASTATEITAYKILSCEMSEDNTTAVVKVSMTTKMEDGSEKTTEESVNFSKDEEGKWRIKLF